MCMCVTLGASRAVAACFQWLVWLFVGANSDTVCCVLATPCARNHRFTFFPSCSGVIPDVVFDRLRSLEVIDLSHNAFTGPLPTFDWAHYMGSNDDNDDEDEDNNGNGGGGGIRDGDGDESIHSTGTSTVGGGSSVAGSSVDAARRNARRLARRAKRAAAMERARRAGKSAHPLSHLEVMDLSYNRLCGELPAWLRTLPAIRRLSLAHNRFEGPLHPLLLPPPASEEGAEGSDCDGGSAARGGGVLLPPPHQAGHSLASAGNDGEDSETATYGFGWGLTSGKHGNGGEHGGHDGDFDGHDGASMAEYTAASSTLTPSRAPPALVDYLRTIFEEHDHARSGLVAWHELWWIFRGLGLGLLDGDIERLHARANARLRGESHATRDDDAALTFAEFAPVALTLLRDCFDAREWGRTKRYLLKALAALALAFERCRYPSLQSDETV